MGKHDCYKWREEGMGCTICGKSGLLSKEEIKELQEHINWRISEQNVIIAELLKACKLAERFLKIEDSQWDYDVFLALKQAISKAEAK